MFDPSNAVSKMSEVVMFGLLDLNWIQFSSPDSSCLIETAPTSSQTALSIYSRHDSSISFDSLSSTCKKSNSLKYSVDDKSLGMEQVFNLSATSITHASSEIS